MPLDEILSALRMSPSVMGAGSLGRGAAKRRVIRRVPQEERNIEAQRNAAKLGLPPENTAMERAELMGFDLERPVYHGALSDISNIHLERSNPRGYAGRGFYTTPSPEDASRNYASIYGPDPRNRMLDTLEDYHNPPIRTIERLITDRLTPRQIEKVLAGTGRGDNLGVVYPLLLRYGKEANLVEPGRSALLSHDPGQALLAQRALNDYNAVTPPVLGQLKREPMPADEVAKRLRREIHGKGGNPMYDPETGLEIGAESVASRVLRSLGVDTFTHDTRVFPSPLNISRRHTVALNPSVVRSRYAAFDPARIDSPDILGAATPSMLGTLAAGSGATVAALRAKKRQEEPEDAYD